MSRTVDERVVEMRFDNRQFEQNVQTSLSTLQKLKQSLKLEDSVKGLESIDSATKKVSFDSLSNGVEAVRVKFSALQVMAVTALQNITNSAIDAGRRIVKSLTVEPVKEGFDEYELKMGSVQTIMASTGASLKEVNKYLNELNTYSDKTIYSFSDMTNNIGKFTNAGVKLEDAVMAIKGISNEAAVSGANADEASRAMYNFSQALSAGSVKLIDWKSIENANMATVEFKNQLLKAAEAAGTVEKQSDGMYKVLTKDANGALMKGTISATQNFNDSLSHQWMTTEVLVNTLKDYADENTEIGKKAFAAAQDVKTFTQLMDTLKEAVGSGWAQTWETLFGDFEEAKVLWTELSQVLGGFIDAQSDARNSMLQGWKDMGGREELIDAFRNAFEGLASVVKPVKEAFREIFPPMTAKNLYNITKSLKEFTSHLKLSESQSAKVKSTFKGFFAALDIGLTVIKAIAGGVKDLVVNLTGFGDGILDVTGSWGDWVSGLRDSIKDTDVFAKSVKKVTTFITPAILKIKEFFSIVTQKIKMPSFESFLDIMQTIWSVVQTIGGKISEACSGIGEALASTFRSGDISAGLDILNGGLLAGILMGVKNFVGGIEDSLDGVNDILENVTGILDSVRGCFEAYQQNLKAGTLLKIAGAIGILAASILVIATIKPEKLTASLGAITALFGELMGSLAIFSKISGDLTGTFKACTAMISISAAVLILASALKKLSSINPEGIVKGLVAIGGLMAELALFLGFAKLDGKMTSTSMGILILSSAMVVLASAVKKFGGMSWEEIGKGLASVGALLLEISAFTKLTGNAKKVISTATAMVILASSMKIFASAIKDFGNMSWEHLGRGLAAMAGALTEVTIAMRLLPKNMVSLSTGLLVVGAALKVLASALKDMGGMKWDEIARGLVAMGGSLAILAVSLNAMKGTIGGSAAMIVAAGALAILAPTLKSLGSMSWEQIGKGLVTLAGAFTILGVAGLVLQPLVPSILGLSASFALLGIAVLGIGAGLMAAGVGISAIATGLGMLATVTAGSAAAIVASLTIIVTGIASLIPVVAAKIGEAIIVLCKVITQGTPAIGEAIKAVVLTLVDVLVECVPALAEGALQLLAGVLDALVRYTPQIVDSLFQFLIGVLEGIARNLPALIQAAVDVLMAFFSGITDALSGIDTDVLLKGIVGIGLLSAIMLALSAVASLVPGAMVGVLGMGAVIAEMALLLAAIGALAQIPGLSWLINEGGELLEGIGTAIGKFIGGIVGGVMSGITSQFPQIGTDLSSFMTNIQPFVDGASKIQPSMMDGAKALVETILLLTAADLLQGVTSWITGGSSLTDFATQLVPFGEAMVGFSNVISGMDADLVAKAAVAGKTLAEMAATLPNSGGVLGFFSGENDMNTFGEQLIPFGKAMMDFSNTVKGLDADVIVNAATAGKAIAEMASTLPNSGGVVGFFAGENDMNTFGEQLVPFGKAMMDFSLAVRGLDADTIVNSATAGKALVELANTVPNSGGVVGFFAGENDMDMFGEQLVPFGRAMKSYSDEVAGIDASAITNSATAGKALVELANTLPNTGGVVSWFTGNNDIGDFGERLIDFGRNFSAYSDYMKNVDSSIVTATASAASSIVELEKSLPESGGWFSDDTTLAEFGEDIESFGSYFSNFYNHISKVSASSLTAVIREIGNLISLSKDMSSMDTSGMSGFGKALVTMGENGINEFLKVFKDATSKVEASAKSLITSFTTGISTGKDAITTSMTALVTNAMSAVHNKYSDFYNTGKYMVQGFANGISSNSFMASAQATAMAKAAVNAANAELGVHSPSKVFAQIGGYVVSGFANGINSNKGKAAESTKGLAKVGVDVAKAVLKSLKSSNSVFKEYAENTDKNGKKIKMTLKTAAEAFKSFRNSVKDSIKDATGVFDEFSVETDVTGKELLKNLKSQITGITEWASNIRILADRGINKGLLKVLSDMGPSGAKYVNALVTMSNKELKKLNKLYKQRLSLNGKAADEIATSFLDGGKKAAKAYSKGVKSGSKGVKLVGVIESVNSSTSATVKAVETMKEKIQSIMSWTYEGTVKSVKKSLDYGKGAFSQFCKAYLSSTKNITLGTKAIKAASSAITVYGKKLYEESDYYAEDTANLKTHKKELSSLQKERTKLQKQLKKAQKSNTKASKARAKALKSELKANNKAIKEAKKQVKADEKEIAEHTKEVFNELHNTLAESVSTFLDPLKVSLESGIDLFKKFESNTDLYEADKKNLEEHQKTLAELETTQKEILDEIAKYSDKNTLAARKRVKELNKQLSEVESSIEEAKSNIEQAENDMASHSQVTVDSILENMQSQITGVTKWQQNLKTLAARGVSQGLLEELKKMGTDGVDYVDQFMKMTNDEIAKANSLFAQSSSLTSQTLIDNFQESLNETKNWAAGLQKMAEMGFSQDLLQKIGEMGVDGYEYVSAFLTMTPDQVAQFNQQFAESLKLPDTVADQVISSYAYAGGQSIAGFTSALAKLTESGSDENAALVAMATEIGNVISKTLKKESKSGGKKAVDELSKSMKKNKKTAKEGSKSVGKATLKGLKEVLNNTAGKNVANNICSGLKNGLNSGKSSVSATAQAVAQAAYKAAKAALGIKSPSRMFAKLGEYTDAGFVKGLESGEKDIYNTATDIMGKTIKDIYDALNSDVETQPTIRPVMDLTDIQNGADEIGNMMNGYSIAGSLDLANATASAMNRNAANMNDSTLNAIGKLQSTLSNLLSKPSIEQNNHFDIRGDNPKEIADEVSHILQKQVERRNATWA